MGIMFVKNLIQRFGVIGNSPITETYSHKVDFLKTSGVIQQFLSINPNPTNTNYLKETHLKGFLTITNFEFLKKLCFTLLNTDMNYFSSMISKTKLGQIISIANEEKNKIKKTEKFLSLIRE